MYQSHFGLQELPFGITPDTSFAYACAKSHQIPLFYQGHDFAHTDLA